MRRRILLVVAATTSAVILSFVIPLCTLVATLAQDRAVAAARAQAQNAAILVTTLTTPSQLGDALRLIDVDPQYYTSILLPSGQALGRHAGTMSGDPLVQQSRDANSSFTRNVDGGVSVLQAIVGDHGTTVIRTQATAEALRQGVMAAWLAIIGVGMVLLLGALVIADRLGRRISSPVVEVAAVAHRLRAGELQARAVPAGTAEVVELSEALNQLADRIGELLVAEREVAADLSHRLRTPVTALRLDAETVADPEVAERLREHIDNLQRTVDAVVAEARRPVREPLRGTSDARAAVVDRIRFWQPLAEDQGREVSVVTTALDPTVGVAVDDLRDLLDNLIDNVFAHTPEGTDFGVELSRDQDIVTLVVFDHGPGLGDPGLTRRGSSGSGSTGLGLDIVRRIARAAGGELVVRDRERGGAEFRVTMPAVTAVTPAPSEGWIRGRRASASTTPPTAAVPETAASTASDPAPSGGPAAPARPTAEAPVEPATQATDDGS